MPEGDIQGPDDSDRNKNRPSDSKFKQQKLPAWQPILTAGTVLPTFFIIGIIFVPIGVGLLVSSNKVHEQVHDYTDCKAERDVGDVKKGTACRDIVQNLSTIQMNGSCVCSLTIEIKKDWGGEVLLYYGLSNFYQNHRRYVKSRSDAQLLGDLSPSKVGECKPYQSKKIDSDEAKDDKKAKEEKIIYAPCGAIANSLFNDSVTMKHDGTKVNLLKTNIAWPTDKRKKFKNPKDTDKCGAPKSDPGCWEKAFNNTIQPPYWSVPVWQLDEEDPQNTGFENEDLIVWMRTAALPNFRKLWRRVDHSQEKYKGKLPSGNYTIEINYQYPVTQFGGSKRVILSTSSWLGARNPFLGIAYIVVGSLCILLGIVFLVIHVKFGRSLAELSNVSSRS